MSALARAGLVDLEDQGMAPAAPEHPESTAGASTAQTAESVASLAPPAPDKPSDAGAIELSLEQIYTDAGVPESPFPAERMLKVLGGLRAMDINTRRAAVLAIDAADDHWKIDDVLLDTDRKIKALESHKAVLMQQASAAEDAARSQIADRDRRQQEAVASIRQQIADLQALMEREVETATHDKKDAQQRAEAARANAQRGCTRLDQEIAALREIPTTFPIASPPQG